MEQSQILLFLVASTPFILYLCLYKLNSTKAGAENINYKLPPGTSGFPFIGESISYYRKLRRGRQYEFVKERMDKYSSKVFRTSLMGKPVAVLCGPEGNKFLFANENKLVRLWWPDSINKLFPKSDNRPNSEHSRMLHKNILPFFLKPDALSVGLMDDVMKQHLDAYWTGKNEVKVGEMAKKYTLALACNFFLGINDLSNIEDVVRGIDDIDLALMAIRINLPGTAWNRGLRASKILQSKIEAFVRQRKHGIVENQSSSSNSSIRAKDFITHLLLAVDENGQFYKEGDIAGHVASMIEAAYTTLRMTITVLIKILSDLPAVYESVLREQIDIAESKEARNSLSWEDIRKMKYSWNVVCEVFRLYLSGLSFKEAITDFTYEGYTIPKGWKIHMITHGTHRNPNYFKDPDKFDPTRFDGDGPAPYTFIPFAGGPRMCPGNEYARLASLTFVHYVVIRFSWEKMISDERMVHFPFAYPAEGLPIRFYPRK